MGSGVAHRSCISSIRGGSRCSPRSCVSPCRAGMGCTPRRFLSVYHGNMGYTPSSCISTCRESSRCTPCTCVSPCREGRGCTPRSCLSLSHADTGCTPRTGIYPCRAGTQDFSILVQHPSHAMASSCCAPRGVDSFPEDFSSSVSFLSTVRETLKKGHLSVPRAAQQTRASDAQEHDSRLRTFRHGIR